MAADRSPPSDTQGTVDQHCFGEASKKGNPTAGKTDKSVRNTTNGRLGRVDGPKTVQGHTHHPRHADVAGVSWGAKLRSGLFPWFDGVCKIRGVRPGDTVSHSVRHTLHLGHLLLDARLSGFGAKELQDRGIQNRIGGIGFIVVQVGVVWKRFHSLGVSIAALNASYCSKQHSLCSEPYGPRWLAQDYC